MWKQFYHTSHTIYTQWFTLHLWPMCYSVHIGCELKLPCMPLVESGCNHYCAPSVDTSVAKCNNLLTFFFFCLQLPNIHLVG